jgi:general secretion pathway protein A
MYTWFYGFSEEPFHVNPDPRFLYLTETHRQALNSMTRGILDRNGFILILGELGSGKTTLIQHLLNTIDRKVKAVAIFRHQHTYEELLEDVLRELKVPSVPQNKVSLVRQLNDYLHSLTPDQTLAILIDDAQDLSPEIMEELRLLPTPETLSAKKLQIVLVGQPELKGRLDSPNLRELKQRVEIMDEIRPLNEGESRQYIAHRLEKVDSEVSKVFTPEAIDLICRHARGNPRTLNILCDNAFLVGYGLSKKKVDTPIVNEVLEDLDFVEPEELEEKRPKEVRRVRGAAAAGKKGVLFRKIGLSLLALLGVGAIIFLGRVYLKGPEEPPMAKFPIQPPAILEKAPSLPPEGKPARVAQAVPQPEVAKQPGLQEKPSRPAEGPPTQKAPPSSPPPGTGKKPDLTAPSAEKKIPPPVPPKKMKPASAVPGKTKSTSPPPSRTAGLRSKGEARIKKTVIVKKGENIYTIAARNYGVANTSVVDQILEVNPRIPSSHRLLVNQRVRLPEIAEKTLVLDSGDGTYQVRLGTFLRPEYSNFL